VPSWATNKTIQVSSRSSNIGYKTKQKHIGIEFLTILNCTTIVLKVLMSRFANHLVLEQVKTF